MNRRDSTNKKDQTFVLKKQHFSQFIGNVYYFFRFAVGSRQFEICLEPCIDGFDVALYERFGDDKPYNLMFPKECLREEGYDEDVFGEIERTNETWQHALQIANEMMVKVL